MLPFDELLGSVIGTGDPDVWRLRRYLRCDTPRIVQSVAAEHNARSSTTQPVQTTPALGYLGLPLPTGCGSGIGSSSSGETSQEALHYGSDEYTVFGKRKIPRERLLRKRGVLASGETSHHLSQKNVCQNQSENILVLNRMQSEHLDGIEDKDSFRDTRTLSELYREKTEAENFTTWEKSVIFPSYDKFPYPKKYWNALLKGEATQEPSRRIGPSKKALRNKEEESGEWCGARKRKRFEDLEDWTDLQRPSPATEGFEGDLSAPEQFIIDGLDEDLQSSYYSWLRNQIDNKTELETKEQRDPMVSCQAANYTLEDAAILRASLESEAIQRAGTINPDVTVEPTNKRQRLGEALTGFSTSFYRAIKAVIRFVFSKNT